MTRSRTRRQRVRDATIALVASVLIARVGSAERPPDAKVDVLADEMAASIHHADVDAGRMSAAGGDDRLPLIAGRPTIDHRAIIDRRIGRLDMVVKARDITTGPAAEAKFKTH